MDDNQLETLRRAKLEDRPKLMADMLGIRADITTGSLSSGGALPTEAADRFIQIAQNATPILAACRRVTMPSKDFRIPKIVMNGRMLKAAPAEGAASGSRVAPTTSEVTLNAKPYQLSVKITDEMLEDNIERAKFEGTLMGLIAEKVGLDTEEIALASDTGSGDPDLALQNGWLTRITSNVVDAADANVSQTVFEAGHRAVPMRFRRGKHLWFVQEHAGETWRSVMSARQTALGDAAILNGQIPPAVGRPVMQVGNMPVTAATGPHPDVSKVLFTDPQNLILGFWREVRVEIERVARESANYIVVTTRMAFAVEHEAAASLIENVRAE